MAWASGWPMEVHCIADALGSQLILWWPGFRRLLVEAAARRTFLVLPGQHFSPSNHHVSRRVHYGEWPIVNPSRSVSFSSCCFPHGPTYTYVSGFLLACREFCRCGHANEPWRGPTARQMTNSIAALVYILQGRWRKARLGVWIDE